MLFIDFYILLVGRTLVELKHSSSVQPHCFYLFVCTMGCQFPLWPSISIAVPQSTTVNVHYSHSSPVKLISLLVSTKGLCNCFP